MLTEPFVAIHLNSSECVSEPLFRLDDSPLSLLCSLSMVNPSLAGKQRIHTHHGNPSNRRPVRLDTRRVPELEASEAHDNGSTMQELASRAKI